MTHRAFRRVFCSAILTTVTSVTAQVPSQPYGLVDIGVLPGRMFSAGFSVSNTGLVAGVSSSAAGQQAFIWRESAGILGLQHPTGVGDSVAHDVNDLGQVIGTSFSPNGVGVLWNANGAVSYVFNSSTIDQPTKINNAGSATGYRNVPGSQSAFVWNGSYVDLGFPFPAGSSQGYDINNLGQVAGNLNGGQASGAFSSAPAAFLWTPGRGFVTIQSTVSFASMTVTALSDAGVVVGIGDNNTAWSWSSTGGFGLLAGLASAVSTRAFDVNINGLIVGNSGENGVVWDSDGSVYNVNSLLDASFSDWRVTTIRGVNDLGWLVGEALNPSGAYRAVLLRPSGPSLLTLDLSPFGGMPNTANAVVPLGNRLSNQFLYSDGILFSSGAPFAAIVNIGSSVAPAGQTALMSAAPNGRLSLTGAYPIRGTFFSPNNGVTPAVTNYVSVQADLVGGTGNAVLTAFGLDGSVLATRSVADAGGEVVSVSVPGIHRWEFTGNGTIYIGNIRFEAVTPQCAGDLNLDAAVDDADFVAFAVAYDLLICADPAMPVGCPADLNADRTVDDSDFVVFAAAYDIFLCP